MFARLRTLGLLAAASIGLAGCAYDDGYGYGGVSVGYGAGYYDDYYGYGSYGYGYGYGYPAYYGWYGGFYYPGSGYWVYDRSGHRHRWSDRDKRYWEGRKGHWSGQRHDNWSGYRGGSRQGSGLIQGSSQASAVPVAPVVREPRGPRQGFTGRGSSMQQRQPTMRQDRSGGSRNWGSRGSRGHRR